VNAFLTSRVGPAAGALGSALLFAGLMIANAATETMSIADSPATIAGDYAAHREDIRLGVALALAGVFLVIWFLGFLHRRVDASDHDRGRLGAVVAAGGAIGLAAVLVHLGILVAATNEEIAAAPETARTFLILGWEYGGVLAPAFGAFVGATSLALVRGAHVPALARGIGWLGLPLALVLALSGFLGGFFVVLALLWQLVLALAFVLVPGSRRGTGRAGGLAGRPSAGAA
jgi:hypothetical protein